MVAWGEIHHMFVLDGCYSGSALGLIRPGNVHFLTRWVSKEDEYLRRLIATVCVCYAHFTCRCSAQVFLTLSIWLFMYAKVYLVFDGRSVSDALIPLSSEFT